MDRKRENIGEKENSEQHHRDADKIHDQKPEATLRECKVEAFASPFLHFAQIRMTMLLYILVVACTSWGGIILVVHPT